jgi:hypothetical protein
MNVTVPGHTPKGTVVLRLGHDPFVYDEHGKEVTTDVYKIEMLPGRKAWAYRYARNASGKFYKENNEVAKDTPIYITEIVGHWRP